MSTNKELLLRLGLRFVVTPLIVGCVLYTYQSLNGKIGRFIIRRTDRKLDDLKEPE